MNQALRGSENKKKKIRLIQIFLLGVILSAIYALLKSTTSEFIQKLQEIFDGVESTEVFFSTHLLVNILVLVIIIMLLLLIKAVFKVNRLTLLMLFVFLDLGLHTQLSTFHTLVFNLPYKEYKIYFDELPNEINQENLDKPLEFFNESQELKRIKAIWGNLSTFNKTISFKGYNPFQIKYFNNAYFNGDLERNLKNPLFFFAQRERSKDDSVENGLVWGEAEFRNLEQYKTSLKNVAIGYNCFTAQVANHSEYSQILLINQNYYHGWKAYLNSRPTEIRRLNGHIMGLSIPARQEVRIDLKFEDPNIYIFIIITLLGYLFVFIYLFYVKWSKK